jgi:hypothetical protein
VKCSAATRAGVARDIQNNIFARQMRWQTARLFRFRGLVGLRFGRKRLFGARNIGVEIFDAELQLVGIEALGTASELRALELPDNDAKLFDLALRFAQLRAISLHRPCHVAHETMQQHRIARQVVEIESQAVMLVGDDSARQELFRCLAYLSVGRALHPASSGRHVRSGERQSMPSINIDNCAGVSAIVPPVSIVDG